MSTVEFKFEQSAGRLFWVERCFDLDDSMVEWVGDAIGSKELPDNGYVGIVLTKDVELRRELLAKLDPCSIQLVYFRNPFELRSLLEDLFPEANVIFAGPDAGAEDEDCFLLRDLTGLRAIDVSSSDVTDLGAKTLSELLTLESLSLADSKITDMCLEALSGLAGLKQLDISLSAISDDGIHHLTRLTNLENLGLADTAVTDYCIEHLSQLKNLKFLDISDTAISPDGIFQLCEVLPACDVWPS